MIDNLLLRKKSEDIMNGMLKREIEKRNSEIDENMIRII
jgi:hypothetical protein